MEPIVNETKQRLKRETESLHKRIETTELMRNLMSPSLTSEQYALTLEVWFVWLSIHQANIKRHLPRSFSELISDRLTLLKADLFALNGPNKIDKNQITDKEAEVINRTTESFISNPEHALGAMYVLEGSALGGMVVTKHVKSILGQSTPTHFYQNSLTNSIPADLINKWRHFTKMLDHYVVNQGAPERCQDSDRLNQMCDGAKATFGSLIHTFEQPLHVRSIPFSNVAKPTYQSELSWT